MRSLNNELYNNAFSHIYIEKEGWNHPNTKKILSHFPNAVPIEITHYKDVFCRSNQNYQLQKSSPNLILAVNKGSCVYEGAPVCQSFGNEHFYYASSVMNCLYDCEYCYLQGMYPSANIVVYVNIEDIFEEVELLLKQFPVYLCISYDTDLLALDGITGYVKAWYSFSEKHPDLSIELRTKSANWRSLEMLNSVNPNKNFILAWTLSPDAIQKEFEHHTPPIEERLLCINKALQNNFAVRLCFDPLIYHKNWKDNFKEMIQTTFKTIQPDKLKDISLGIFRVSSDYLKQMRKQRMDSLILQYPFENDKGVYHYSLAVTTEMINYVLQLLQEFIPEEKIYLWKETIL